MAGLFKTLLLCPIAAVVLSLAAVTGCSKSDAPAAKTAAAPAVPPAPSPVPVAAAPPATPAPSFDQLRAAREQAQQLELKADAAEARARIAEMQLSDERARNQQTLVQGLSGALDAATAENAALRAAAEENADRAAAAEQAAYDAQQQTIVAPVVGMPVIVGRTHAHPAHPQPYAGGDRPFLLTPPGPIAPLAPAPAPAHHAPHPSEH